MSRMKILMILSDLDVCNGTASFVMNYYRSIYKQNLPVRFDFLVMKKATNEYYEEIVKSNSDRIYVIRKNNIIKYIVDIFRFFRVNSKHYDIVHCNVANTGLFYLLAAKLYGVDYRILHSHITQSSDKRTHKIRNDMVLPIVLKLANYYFACSKDAGKYMFADRPYTIIPNAVDIDRFAYNERKRQKIRNIYDVSKESYLIGFVGRFTEQKNPLYAVEIFSRLVASCPQCKMIMVGEGLLYNRINEVIKKKNISDKIVLVQGKSNIEDFYSAFDAFFVPSIYEGLGIVFVEAQISGLKTYTSNCVPQETHITELIKYISLSEEQTWVGMMKEGMQEFSDRSNAYLRLKGSIFDIDVKAGELVKEYQRILKER